jgi:diguanylate cyclase (GGDEF)-like protein
MVRLYRPRADGPLTLAMIDVDCFKAYNDHFGHAKGDQALKTVAETLAGAAWRPYHLAARYGGEEFALILPGSTDAAALVEDMRQSVAALRLPHPKSTASPYLSISCGMASRIPGRACSPESLLRASDAALYEAKQRGRNRVIAVRIRG